MRKHLALLLVVLWVFVLCGLGGAAAPPPAPLPDVTTTLYRPKDNRVKSLPAGEVILFLRSSVAIKKGQTLEKLLTQRGIHPNADAIAVLYELNPGTDEKSLRDRRQLVLPEATGGKEFERARQHGYLALLSLHRGLKQRYASNVDELAGLLKQLDALPPDASPDLLARTDFATSVALALRAMSTIRNAAAYRTHAFPAEMLQQVDDEVVLLNTVVQGVIDSGGEIDEGAAQAAADIADDVAAQAEPLASRGPASTSSPAPGPTPLPARVGEAVVVVDTQGEGRGRYSTLRACYINRALWEHRLERPELVRRFTGLLPGCKESIPIGDYQFWAVKGADAANTPVSEVLLVTVVPPRDGGKIEVILVVP